MTGDIQRIAFLLALAALAGGTPMPATGSEMPSGSAPKPASLDAAESAAGATNLIVNGTFASNLSGWTEEHVDDLTSNWSSKDAAGSAASGSFWGQAKGGTTWPSQYNTHGTVGWQCLEVEPDRVYRMAMDAKVKTSATGIASLYVRDITGSACPTLTHVGDFPPPDSRRASVSHGNSEGPWVSRTEDFRTGPGETRVQVGLHVRYGRVDANGGFAMDGYFDNVRVGKVRADLSVDMAASETSLRPLQTFTVDLSLSSLTSNGMTPEVRVYHAGHLALVSHNCPGSVVNGTEGGQGRFLWFGIPDDVDPYQQTCTITARAKTGVAGPFDLRAVASCGECGIESRLDNNERTIAMATQAAPDVGVQSLALDPFPNAGSPVDLTVAFHNHGTAFATSSVSVALSPNLVFVPSGQGSCANFGVSGSQVAGAVALSGGETVNCTLRFDIPASQTAAQLTATVTTATTNDYDAGNDSVGTGTRIVRLRVNRTIDGFDRTPGDGICEQAAGAGDCTLRGAVMEANALGGRRTIEIPYSSNAYELTHTLGDDDVLKGDIDIRTPMILRGEPNASGHRPIVQAAFPSDATARLLSVQTTGSSSTIIERLVLSAQALAIPTTDGNGHGGVIHHATGELVLRDVVLRHGRAGTLRRGGGLYSAGSLTLTRVEAHDNVANAGGGLAIEPPAFAIVTVLDSHLHDNQAVVAAGNGGFGGGLWISTEQALVAVRGSTLSGNSARYGGGLALYSSPNVSLRNATVTSNTAGVRGGGVYVAGAALPIDSTTIVHNDAAPDSTTAGEGGGIWHDGTSPTLRNSILAYNSAQLTSPVVFPHKANCSPSVTSLGHNSITAGTTDSGCSIIVVQGSEGDKLNGWPSLGALQDNGGPTPTHALASVGNEVDFGDCGSGLGQLTTDQRGAARPTDGDGDGQARCDKGAYELSDTAPITVTRAGGGNGVVFSTPSGILCGSACSALFAFDSEVTLTASAHNGSEFAGWSGDCAAFGTSPCVLRAVGDLHAEARFELADASHTLSVALGEDGSGTVGSDPSGISCPAGCSADFDAGTAVTLTAVPDPDSIFIGFFGGGCDGTAAPCTVTMGGDRAVTALFDFDYTDLTVTTAGAGVGRVVSTPVGIDCPGDCQDTYVVTGTVTLSATAAVGSVFAGWSGACTGTGSCVLDMDQGPHAATATFDTAPDTLFRNGFE